MMESTSTTTDQQTPPAIPMNNSSSRRKQSRPNRLEYTVVEPPSTCDTIASSSILPSLTQYHVAAEQQEIGNGDDDFDRISLNCEDGSLSSHSTGEHYAMEDIINRSRRILNHQQIRTNEKMNFDENEEQEHQIDNTIGVLDFSLKLDETNKHSTNSNNRSRSINTIGKSRSLKRKHSNGTTITPTTTTTTTATAAVVAADGTITMPTRIFHADAFCGICRKEFCNKYFLKTHLANKHGIFDQSINSSVSTPSLQGNTDTNNDSNLQHPFTVISTLIHNGHEDFSSSPLTSPSSDLTENHQNKDNNNNDDENETELSSLRHEMNGVLAGDEDNHHQQDNHDHNNDDDDDDDDDNDDDDDDDEQDGTNSNSLINLPQKISTILSNDNSNLNDNNDDQQNLTANSPTNSLDYQQQQQQQISSSQTSILPPTPSSSTTTNLSRQSSAKLPEDFCDICQKHFCNKYYLRKHKLDVHGVQTDCNIKPYKRIDNNALSTKKSPPSTSSNQISSSIQLPSSFPNVTFNPSSVQQSLGMLLNPIFSPLVQSQTNSEQTLLLSNKRRHTDNSNESSSSSLSLSKPQFPPSLLTAASDVFANQLNSSTATTTSSSKSQISTCHLCGKKFQNNDYLQLHLMNKHQIKTDYDSQQQRTKMSNLIKSSNETLNSNTVKKIKLETNETPSSSTITTVIKASSPIDTITSPNPSAVISGIVDTYFAAKMADRVSCDICHKQVCNKYFLKTHKLKVHGIGPDPTVVSSSSSAAATTAVPLTNSETIEDNIDQQQSRSSYDGSPPQLVVDEMNPTNIEPGFISSPDALTASINTFIGINNNNTNTNNNSTNNDTIEQLSTTNCEICSKSFPTKFLHVHMNNIHGIQQPPIIVTNGTTNNKNQLVGNTIKRPLTNGNTTSTTTTNNINNNNNNNVRLKQTPQVQLRVTCQVCKKELCNKYFLRAHMRNVHNISVDDLRLIQQQQSPSSDQQSSKSTVSLSSNILSSTSIIPTDINLLSTIKHSSSSNDNDLNGHMTDSNESENLNNLSSSTSLIKTNDNNNNNNNHLLSMQQFLVESDDDLYKDLFVPCMVSLPCRHRVTKPLEVSLRLKPVDHTTSITTSTTATTVAD